MHEESSHQEEVDLNFEAFQKLLPDIVQSNTGKYALMNHGNIVDFFDSIGDAVKFGREKFGELRFSVQQVPTKNANLGYHSYAVQRLPN